MDLGQAIVDGTNEVFSTMLMVELEVVDIIEGKGGSVSSNITSMIGLGKDIRGMLAVHCPASVAKDITGTFLGMEVLELDDDVKDAIGEIANMVAGNLKVSFAQDEIDVQIATPTTIIGKSFSTTGLSETNRVVVQFLMNGTSFMVELKYIYSNNE